MLRRHWTYWTDEELCELIDLWPTHSVAQIAKHLHRSPSATRERARQLLRDGVLEGTMASHNILVGTGSMTRPIRPDLQDFDEVKRDYCRQHHIDIAQLNARFESDHRLAAELYRLAQTAKFNRLTVGGDRSSLQGVLPGP
jgi:DNA-binding Lrp family transcriptional regulator